ncbi:MAG: DUF4232 domain-containing protein [Marmoricola sp.]
MRPLLNRRLILAAALLALVASTGCGTSAAPTGGGDTDTVTSSGSGSAAASSAPTSSPRTPTPRASGPRSSGSSSSSPVSGVARCRTSDLEVTDTGAEGAMGTSYSRITLTNTSAAPCVVQGYGGVSYVAGGNGTQVGARATRDRFVPAKRMLLQPDEGVEARLGEGTAMDYPKATCRPTKVEGLRIYPPDETHSVFVPHPATACANPKVGTLQLQAYAPAR